MMEIISVCVSAFCFAWMIVHIYNSLMFEKQIEEG